MAVVQNPTLSLAGDVAATHQVLDGLDGPAVLVGHSYGGAVITEVGNHPNVAALAYPRRVRVRSARLREHAGAEVDARDRSLAQGFEDPHARAGATAHVQSPAERPERSQRAGGRVKHAIAGTERRAVELRGEQVVAALDRGQRLPRQFA